MKNCIALALRPSRLFVHLFPIFCVLLLLTGCASSKTIVNGLDEREANEILVFLASRGIQATKMPSTESGGTGASKLVLWDIAVPEEQANEAMALLNQSGLPRRKSQSLLGIFTGGGLVPSELQERIRYQAGLAEQIASTIRKIDGVLETEVHISFPEEDPLNPGKMKGHITASVYVKHSGVLDDPNSHLITKIRRLVAASVTGLDYDNVTVIADRARYGGASTVGETSGEEPKQLVNVWSIMLAKESVARFQILFFSILMLLLLFLLILVWLGWKFHTVLHKTGGFGSLFHLHPLEIVDESKKEEEGEKKDAAEGAAAEQPPASQTDKDVDVT